MGFRSSRVIWRCKLSLKEENIKKGKERREERGGREEASCAHTIYRRFPGSFQRGLHHRVMKHPLEITSPLYAFLSSQRPVTAELRQESLRINTCEMQLVIVILKSHKIVGHGNDKKHHTSPALLSSGASTL